MSSWEEYPFIKPEDGERKKAICLSCELFDPETLKCKSCDCFVPQRIQLYDSPCPEGKW